MPVRYALSDPIGRDSIPVLARLTVADEAAERSDVTPDAVRRKRVRRRGTIPWAEGTDGPTYVWVGPSETRPDESYTTVRDGSRDALLATKDETIAELRDQGASLRRDAEDRKEECPGSAEGRQQTAEPPRRSFFWRGSFGG